MNFLSVVLLAFKRLWNNKGLTLCLTVGLIVAVALPASAIGPWRVSQADDSDGNYPGCGSYRHQNSGGQPDACNCDRVRLRLADGSCGNCPRR